ncbi:MAG: helix-turn-helix domain-containing protein [Limisphaerales bacterium]
MARKHLLIALADQAEHRLALTRTEAAHRLGIHANSLDRLVARGLIHPSRALRRPLFAVQELERFLQETAV